MDAALRARPDLGGTDDQRGGHARRALDGICLEGPTASRIMSWLVGTLFSSGLPFVAQTAPSTRAEDDITEEGLNTEFAE